MVKDDGWSERKGWVDDRIRRCMRGHAKDDRPFRSSPNQNPNALESERHVGDCLQTVVSAYGQKILIIGQNLSTYQESFVGIF